MELVFASEYAEFLFLANGIALLFYIGAKKRKKERAMKFGNYETLQKVAGKNFLKSSNIVLLTRMLALTALIIGISHPVLVSEQPSTQSDYVLAIDTSSSMLAGDIEPTRLRAAKSVSSKFISQTSNNTRIGIVAFSGAVDSTLATTGNRKIVKARIENLSVGETAGTAIGSALYTSATLFKPTNRSKTTILITDGRSNRGIPLNRSIKRLKRTNVTVHAIGIGETNRTNREYGMINGFNASRADYPNLDTEALFRLTNRTGGNLTTVSDRKSLRKAFLNIQDRKVRTDISIYFIAGALVLMLLEWILGTTRYSILP
ncbi:MAG: VWA domain-containing protein [Candidatus Nanohaloarchaea archaeon]